MDRTPPFARPGNIRKSFAPEKYLRRPHFPRTGAMRTIASRSLIFGCHPSIPRNSRSNSLLTGNLTGKFLF
jgi:hypothetical protein